MERQIAPTCSDVMDVYMQARHVAGQPRAQNVIRRFGTEYAATVPPQHYAAAFEGLTALIRSYESVVEAAPKPTAVRARRKRA